MSYDIKDGKGCDGHNQSSTIINHKSELGPMSYDIKDRKKAWRTQSLLTSVSWLNNYFFKSLLCITFTFLTVFLSIFLTDDEVFFFRHCCQAFVKKQKQTIERCLRNAEYWLLSESIIVIAWWCRFIVSVPVLWRKLLVVCVGVLVVGYSWVFFVLVMVPVRVSDGVVSRTDCASSCRWWCWFVSVTVWVLV